MKTASMNPQSKSMAQWQLLNSLTSCSILAGMICPEGEACVSIDDCWSLTCCIARYAKMYCRACLENDLTCSVVKLFLNKQFLTVILKASFHLFSLSGCWWYRFLVHPQLYLIPSSANSQWHFGVQSTSLPIVLPIDCNNDSSFLKSLQPGIWDLCWVDECHKHPFFHPLCIASDSRHW